jgi:hypothetical protein
VTRTVFDARYSLKDDSSRDGRVSQYVVRSGVCRERYDEAHWSDLPLERRLSAGELASVVLDWPASQVVEVRCGAPVSARRERSTP